jgi:hypothetical protein
MMLMTRQPASLPDARLVRAIQEAVALLETGRTQAAWDLLRAAVPCPPPDYDPPRLPE